MSQPTIDHTSQQQQAKEVYTTPELVSKELLRDITADPTAYSN